MCVCIYIYLFIYLFIYICVYIYICLYFEIETTEEQMTGLQTKQCALFHKLALEPCKHFT